MAKSSEIAEAFAQLALIRDKGDVAARHLLELCTDNPEMMRKAAEAFAEIAEIFTRWKERAHDSQRPGRRPALMHAVMRNDPEKIAALVKAGVWLDETDEGETALHWAVSRQHTEIVTMLLEAGASQGRRMKSRSPVNCLAGDDLLSLRGGSRSWQSSGWWDISGRLRIRAAARSSTV